MPDEFPDDENGDVLRRMQENGDDFTILRKIDFTVVFPDQDSAEGFRARVRRLGFEGSVELTNCVPELPWDVVVVNHMLPSHRGITDFENQLETLALEFGGRNDGWGCIAQKPQS
jgi:hypothetical protein